MTYGLRVVWLTWPGPRLVAPNSTVPAISRSAPTIAATRCCTSPLPSDTNTSTRPRSLQRGQHVGDVGRLERDEPEVEGPGQLVDRGVGVEHHDSLLAHDVDPQPGAAQALDVLGVGVERHDPGDAPGHQPRRHSAHGARPDDEDAGVDHGRGSPRRTTAAAGAPAARSERHRGCRARPAGGPPRRARSRRSRRPAAVPQRPSRTRRRSVSGTRKRSPKPCSCCSTTAS